MRAHGEKSQRQRQKSEAEGDEGKEATRAERLAVRTPGETEKQSQSRQSERFLKLELSVLW